MSVCEYAQTVPFLVGQQVLCFVRAMNLSLMAAAWTRHFAGVYEEVQTKCKQSYFLTLSIAIVTCFAHLPHSQTLPAPATPTETRGAEDSQQCGHIYGWVQLGQSQNPSYHHHHLVKKYCSSGNFHIENLSHF